MDIAGQTEVGRVEDLVCAWVVEDGLGVDTGLVSEGAEACDGVVEGGVDLNSRGDHVLNLGDQEVRAISTKRRLGCCVTHLLEHVELVLALDVLRGAHNHASKKTAKGGDAIALTNWLSPLATSG